MSFLFWLFCLFLVVALVLLLFPFSVRIEFEAGERGGQAFFFFFKKKIYEVKKKWNEENKRTENVIERTESSSFETHENIEASDNLVESVARPPKESPGVEKKTASKLNESEKEKNVENKSENFQSAKVEVFATETNEVKNFSSVVETADNTASNDEKKDAADLNDLELENSDVAESKKRPKKEKRKLSDREFWTILLTPDFDAKVFKYAMRIMTSIITLLRIRFVGCFVEGIRMGYQEMGYGAALNGILKAYPYVGAWDFRMDWTHEKKLRAAGTICASISLLRVICFVLELLVLAGMLMLTFWRRRVHVIKTNKLPDVGFVRQKIIDFIVEE